MSSTTPIWPAPSAGALLERHPAFPNRINVHFVRVKSRTEVEVYHWERGSGATLACGTGACAVAVAGVTAGLTDRRITARLPGGPLELHWSEADGHVHMTGPAVEVFRGEWPEVDFRLTDRGRPVERPGGRGRSICGKTPVKLRGCQNPVHLQSSPGCVRLPVRSVACSKAPRGVLFSVRDRVTQQPVAKPVITVSPVQNLLTNGSVETTKAGQ